MAETPPPSATPETESQSLQYWCYHCDKRVSIEILPDLPDIICQECKNGFVEAIATAPAPPPAVADRTEEISFSNQFLQILRLIADSARDDDAPPPPPPNRANDSSDPDDFIRIELNGWNNNEDDDDEDDEEEGEEEEEDEINFGDNDENRSDNEDEDPDQDANPDQDEEETEETRRRRRREILRLRIRDFATRAASGRNRIVEWSEILMGLEDTAMELRVQMAEADGYVGNPEDYVDAAAYEVLLQNLADSDGGARRGAPPASKSAISALETVEIKSEEGVVMCAICKETVQVGEIARKLPCEHGYHGECIDPWLESRNSCPVCRFELPTDDPEYEEERKRRFTASSAAGGSSYSGVNSSPFD